MAKQTNIEKAVDKLRDMTIEMQMSVDDIGLLVSSGDTTNQLIIERVDARAHAADFGAEAKQARARVQELEDALKDSERRAFEDRHGLQRGEADRVYEHNVALRCTARERLKANNALREAVQCGIASIKSAPNDECRCDAIADLEDAINIEGGGESRAELSTPADRNTLPHGDTRDNRPALDENQLIIDLRLRVRELESVGNDLLDERDKIIKDLTGDLNALREAVAALNDVGIGGKDFLTLLNKALVLALTEGGGESREANKSDNKPIRPALKKEGGTP